jgi:signal transduction histidine kinase
VSVGRPALGIPPGPHALIVVVIAVVAQVEVWTGSGAVYAQSVAALVWALVLLLVPRRPLLAALTSVAVMALIASLSPDAFSGGSFAALGALVLAFMAIGAHRVRRWAVAGGLIALPLALTLAQVPEFIAIVTGGAWLAGLALRTRADRLAELGAHAARLEHERESRTRAAVAAERSRIARDAYDLIAESIDEMTVQAETARVLLGEDPERARAATLAAEECGRRALDETRGLLGMLRAPDADPELAPQPTLAGLPALVART